jgi:uncharacterized protein YbaA (DUF1428 family)
MAYVDGFLLPVPEKNLAAYRKMAAKGAKMWMKHGALQYVECAGDDLAPGFGVPFPKTLRVKPGETVVLAFIVFKSRAHRDRVNAKVMKDPAMTPPPEGAMPFDMKRMLYGGFKTLVNA